MRPQELAPSGYQGHLILTAQKPQNLPCLTCNYMLADHDKAQFLRSKRFGYKSS